jgi:hypothetical protein
MRALALFSPWSGRAGTDRVGPSPSRERLSGIRFMLPI